MHKYFPHTDKDIKEMLETIGVQSTDELFAGIDADLKLNRDLNLPSELSELELRKLATEINKKNKILLPFIGRGAYDVYQPSCIKPLVSRQEFLTSYTPYQPELSQGTLQYIFEYQSMVCELTGLDVSNASLYDGSTALAEAMIIAVSETKRRKVVVSNTVFPHVLAVLRTYAKNRDIDVIEVGDSLVVNEDDVLEAINDDVACVIIGYPNGHGYIDSFAKVAARVRENKSLLVLYTDLRLLATLKSPAQLGADIACGDGQSLGLSLSYGGPYLGFIAVRKTLMRKLPGRIVGMTNDIDGKRGYVLTLQAREQHIRRDKASSNICSNQSLMALEAIIYASIMGVKGMREVNHLAYNNAHYCMQELLNTGLFTRVTDEPFLWEFVLKTQLDTGKLNEYLSANGILGGYAFRDFYQLAVTEMRSVAEIDHFVRLVVAFNE